MVRLLSKLMIAALTLLLSAMPEAAAQYFTAGSDPAGVKWRQMDYDHYSVIYPQGMDSLAKRYLYLFEKSRDHAQAGMRITNPKVPIVLHPYAITGNSTAAWGPKRLEIFTTPKPFGGLPLNYEEETALHTNRLLGYMAQYDTHVFRFMQHGPFGQHAVAFGVGFYPSVWQAVGDAALFVGDETPSGFGRNGEALMFYRAAFVEHDIRSYDRWRYGSYRDYTPSTEAFGYIINSNMRFYSGNWYAMGDALAYQMKDWWDIFGYWNKSFLAASNKTVRKHWRFISAFYPTIWSDDFIRRGHYTQTSPLLGKEERLYTEWRDIVPDADGGAFATKNGMQYAKQLVHIDRNGRQKRLRAFSEKAGRISSSPDGRLFWSEEVPDPRWELRSSSIIRSYDPANGKTRNVSRGTRWFNPSVSASGDALFVAEYKVEGGSSCLMIDSRSGRVLREIPAPDGGQITETAEAGGRLYALIITEKGQGLYSIPTEGGEASEWRCEIGDQHSYLQHLSVSGSNLNFVSDRDGICQIYRYSPAECTLTKAANARFGQFYPTFEAGGDLVCGDYDSRGMHPVRIAADSLEWKPVTIDRNARAAYPMAEHMNDIALNTLDFSADTALSRISEEIWALESRPYRKAGHIFNFHSWAPFYGSVNRIMKMSYDELYQLVGLGATVISQNTLGTAVTQLGYEYHDKRHTGHINFNYTGWYPAIELTADFNDHELLNEGKGKPFSIDAGARVYIPWNFSRGGWNRGLIPYVQGDWCNDGIFNLTYGARWYSMLERSKRQLSPRLGFGVELDGRRAIDGFGTRDLSYIYTYGYLPGFTKDQSLKLTAGFQKQWQAAGDQGRFAAPVYALSNLAKQPRGYKSMPLTDYAKFTADYGIFIYLGDVTWPWLYYLSRMQVVPFADFAINRSPVYAEVEEYVADNGLVVSLPSKTGESGPRYLYSYGADVLVSGHFFRIGSEITIGVRYARTGEGLNTWQVIFNHNMK
ncbi:MAG: hypothetical protein J5699_08220 [Bacteroidales bacterium]|nr:hypothetical protein [Bacteroidales bacterium]